MESASPFATPTHVWEHLRFFSRLLPHARTDRQSISNVPDVLMCRGLVDSEANCEVDSDETLLPEADAPFDVNKHDEALRRQYGTLRMLLLVATCCQTTADVLLRSYSKHTLGEQYMPQSVLLAAELLKLVLSLAAMRMDAQHASIVTLLTGSKAAIVPAICYLTMNLLQYDAVMRLDAASFSTLSQLKLLTSALLSRLLLKRYITAARWRSLMVLVLGVVLIVHQADVAARRSSGEMSECGHGHALRVASMPKGHAKASASAAWYSYLIGVGELLVQTTLSAFVGVFLERYFKRDASALSIWEVNVQLALWSALAYLLLCIWPNAQGPSVSHGIFHGWSLVTCGVAVVAALGGILVALCLRYTDAVLKNLPVACSIVLVSGFSAMWLGGPATLPTGVGASLVAIAIFDYSFKP